MNDKIIYEERYATHPDDYPAYSTERIRKEFLIRNIFEPDKIRIVYSLYDRFIVGGAIPVNGDLSLDSIPPLKSENFCDRREVGIINIGGAGTVVLDGTEYEIGNKESIYIGMGTKNIILKSHQASNPALFYINSTPAHHSFPTRKIAVADAIVLDLGSQEASNARQIIQYIVAKTVETCQLQMGITQLKPGNVWNSFPPHTHNRRMEAYFYTNLPKGQTICHFMGEKITTRPIWLQNNQAVLSPSWSIHCGVGTSSYSFVWGMAGENLDFTDMDKIDITEIQ